MTEERTVGIIGTGAAVPERVLTNADLEKMVDTSDEWIVTRSGIRERRIVEPGTGTSELCVEAAQKALEAAAVAPEDIDLIIVATISPDYPFPSTSCLVQNRIGANRAAAFDLAAGCTGFIYGMAMGSQAIKAGFYNTVLVIGAETLSKITDWTDRSTCVLFGDGAGAVVLRSVECGRGLLSFHLGADGSGGDLLIMPGGGSKNPASEETVRNRMHYLHMNGNEIFKFAVKIIGDASLKALEKCGLSQKDVDLLIPHQANIRIVDAAAKRLGLSSDKVVVNLDKYGNTSSASIPVALDEARRKGMIHEGDIVVLVAFGAGLTWGAAVIRW